MACGDADPAADDRDSGGSEAEAEPTDSAGVDEGDDASANDDELQQDVEDFYSGNTVTIIVGSAAGGGFDTYSRMIARYMPAFIPGEPNMIVENMPGGGNRVAMNHIYNAAPRDGSVIGNASGSLTIAQLFGDPTAQFDMREYRYLGMPDTLGTRVLIAAEHWEGDFDDLFDPDGPELVIGTSAPGALQHDPAVLVEEILEANVHIVDGYDGTGEFALAAEQGEIDAFFNSYHSAVASDADRFESGEWRVLAKFAEADEGGEDLADVPSVYDYADSDYDKDMLFYGAGYPRSFTRIYYLPPETPEHRHEALEHAFQQTLQDPDFLAEAEAAGLDITPLTGDEVYEAVNDFLNLPEDTVADLQEILAIEFD